MAIMAIYSGTTLAGNDLLTTTNQSLETIPPFTNVFPFDLIITNSIPATTNAVVFTDNNDTTEIPMLDRNNKKIQAVQLFNYAGTRCKIHCMYNRVFKVINVCSYMPPVPMACPVCEDAVATTPEAKASVLKTKATAIQ